MSSAETWNDRLRKAWSESEFAGNKAELSRRSGVPYASVDKYLKGIGEQPRGDTVDRLARALGVDAIWLRTGVKRGASALAPAPIREREGTGRMMHIPDLAIHAGMGGGGLIEVLTDGEGRLLDDEQVRGYWSFPDYILTGMRNLKHIYAWEARGDSMEPTIPGGSVVFVDTAQRALPPDDIYALEYGHGLVVKRLKLVPRSSKVLVISDNDRYGQDEMDIGSVTIWGRIVGIFQWRR